MLVTINFPPNGAINTLIAQKYAHFYKNRAKRIRSPRARAILRTQLSSEAVTVASFHGQQVTYETDVRGSSYNPWEAHKWLVTKYRHWYFAGVIKKTRKGGYVFNVKDALYEGDYHNSPIPLCERKTVTLSESDLRMIVKECIRRVLETSADNGVKVYKKTVVDNKGEVWPNNMSDQDIEIQNDFLKKNRITDSSQLTTAWLDCLRRELC
jgi:hypothetical protein